jgi:hypothetical protein
MDRSSPQSDEKMADSPRLVCDFTLPIRSVAKSFDDVADHVRAYGCDLFPSRVIIRNSTSTSLEREPWRNRNV